MSDFTPATGLSDPITLLLVDDQPIVREGLKLLIELRPSLLVIGQASGGHEAVSLAQELQPDVVLMDIRMPQGDGVEATRQLGKVGGPPVLLLTTFEEPQDIVSGIGAGAAGFLFKNTELADLERAIHQVMRGERAIHPRALDIILQAADNSALAPATLAVPLTERELEVLGGLVAGLPNKRIARELGISDSTVKTHLSHIMRKLDARNRTEAAFKARALGLDK